MRCTRRNGWSPTVLEYHVPCRASRATRMVMDHCFLYAIQASDFVKVGISVDVRARASAIQTGCPHPVRLVAGVGCATTECARILERKAHAHLAVWRTGGEWFRYTPDCRRALLDLFDGWS